MLEKRGAVRNGFVLMNLPGDRLSCLVYWRGVEGQAAFPRSSFSKVVLNEVRSAPGVTALREDLHYAVVCPRAVKRGRRSSLTISM